MLKLPHTSASLKKLKRHILKWIEGMCRIKELRDAHCENNDLCCRDLAVDLRMKLGDWFRVIQLLKTGGGGGTKFSNSKIACFTTSLPPSLPSR